MTSTTVDGGSSTNPETGAAPSECLPDPVLGRGECPDACDSCDAGRCQIRCTLSTCGSRRIACPEGWPCDVQCDREDACKVAEIICDSDRDCTIDCQGEGACEDATVRCGDSPCEVSCGAQQDACDELQLHCGGAQSRVTCEASSPIVIVPGDGACECEAIGCR